MLQKIRDKLTGWIALAILGTIGVTFVFVGGANFAFTGSNYAAKVDGVEIGIGQFENAYRDQIQENPQYAALPEEYRLQLRTNILEQLIQQRVIDNYIDEVGYQISDDQITELVQQQPEFQIDGKFDLETYRTVLAQYNYEPASFEQAQRTTLRRGQLERAIRGSSLVAPSGYRRFLNLAFEQRVVRTASVTVESVTDQINVSDEMIEAFYDENPGQYQLPETADIEYVEISRDDVAADVSVTEEQLAEYYENNQDRYLQDEQRQARHILILFDEDEDSAEQVANDLLAKVRAGESFEELARANSKDGGSAAQGGDLGSLTKTQLPGELGDAVFSMSEGDVEGPIKGDFGFHIVQLDKIHERGPLPFEQVRASLVTELQEQEAAGLFLDLERKMSDALFDAADIRELADALDADVKAVAGFERAGGEPFGSSLAAIDAVFNPAVLSGAQLSEVIELDADRTVVLSVTKHNEATRQPLADVRDQIAASLTATQSEELMAAKAQQMLDALAGGDEFDVAAEAIGAQSAGTSSYDPQRRGCGSVRNGVDFHRGETDQGQATTGSTRNGSSGYTVYSLDAVIPGRPEAIPLAERDSGKKRLVDQYGVGDFVAFVQALRANAEVVINDDVLAAQDLFQ